MPCTYTGSLEGDRLMDLKEDLDDMTDKLCRTMRAIEDAQELGELGHNPGKWEDWAPKDVKRWWRRHKREDAKRQKDALKKKGTSRAHR